MGNSLDATGTDENGRDEKQKDGKGAGVREGEGAGTRRDRGSTPAHRTLNT